MTPRLLGILAALGMLVLAGGAGALTAQPQPRSADGRSDAAEVSGKAPGAQVAAPFELHPDLVVLSIKGFDDPEDCSGPEVGMGDEQLCLKVCNLGNNPIIFDLHALTMMFRTVKGATPKQDVTYFTGPRFRIGPRNCGAGGFDVVEDKEKAKEALKAQAAAGELPAAVGVQFLLKTMCLDVHLGVPGEGDTYDIGGRVTDPQLFEILALIEGKTLTDDGADLVQDAIWEVTNYGGLTNEMRAKLRAL